MTNVKVVIAATTALATSSGVCQSASGRQCARRQFRHVVGGQLRAIFSCSPRVVSVVIAPA
jgi:hypothetical protein